MLDENLKKTNNKTVGIKQTLRALEKGAVNCVYVAKDAEQRVLNPILKLCQSQGVKVIEVTTMAELGKACGIEVGAAVSAIIAEC